MYVILDVTMKYRMGNLCKITSIDITKDTFCNENGKHFKKNFGK